MSAIKRVTITDIIVWGLSFICFEIFQNIYIPVGICSILVYCLYACLLVVCVSRIKGYSLDKNSDGTYTFRIQCVLYNKEINSDDILSINYPYLNIKNGQKVKLYMSKKKFNKLNRIIDDIKNDNRIEEQNEL